MKRDLGELEINRLIVHRVPKRLKKTSTEEEPNVEYSDIESPLTDLIRNYFTERVQTSLGTQTLYVRFDPSVETPVIADAVHHCLNTNDPDFVDKSQKVARHLYDCQNANNPGGIVLVAQATIEGIPAIAILKLEEETAIQLRRDTSAEKATFSLEHLRDLTMTNNTKVFKAGLFVKEGDGLSDIEGHVSDKQQNPRNKSGIGVADFFLQKFLGCELRDDPAVITMQYHDLAMRWVNEEVTEPVDKAHYLSSVIVDLKSNLPSTSIDGLARANLALEHRDSFVNFFKDNGFVHSSFVKDLSMISSRMKASTWEFSSGIRVTYPTGTFTDHITVEESENGQVTLSITDTTKKIK